MWLQPALLDPERQPATAGAYVELSVRRLLRLVALESRRQALRRRSARISAPCRKVSARRCGRPTCCPTGSSCSSGSDDGSFVPPGEYPPLAAASAATHDLATLKGFWLGARHRLAAPARRSIRTRPREATEAAERRRDRRLLLEALVGEGLLAPERFGEFLPDHGEPVYARGARRGDPRLSGALAGAADAGAARGRVGEAEQANLPGTTDAHPNWRRRLSRRWRRSSPAASWRGSPR